jgi:hypothetical protein
MLRARMMRCTVLGTTPALSRAHPFVSSVSKQGAQLRNLTKMSSAAEETLDKTTSEAKWKELLTAEEVRRYSCRAHYEVVVEFVADATIAVLASVKLVGSPHRLCGGEAELERQERERRDREARSRRQSPICCSSLLLASF